MDEYKIKALESAVQFCGLSNINSPVGWQPEAVISIANQFEQYLKGNCVFKHNK